MSAVRITLFSMLLVSCGGGNADQPTPDAAPACPAQPPTDGDACTGFGNGAACVYERCADTGLVRATCDATTWSVTATACADLACQGQMCGAGSVCTAQVGGALIIDCRAHSCGDGPLTCDCVCGGDRCDTNVYGGEGAVFSCYIDCGADICP